MDYDKFNLKNKVVVIIGSAGLLGKNYSVALSEAGANVVLADLNFTECKKIQNELKKKFDVDPLVIKVDITKKNQSKKWLKKL